MNPTRWNQIRTLFDELVDLDEAHRAARLQAIGTTDPELRDAVNDLLRADANARAWLPGVEDSQASTPNMPNTEREAILSPEEIQQALGGAFRVERELSGAGMSHVYVAEERAFGRKVVVKVIRHELAQALSARRFQREIQVAARLQHPHIVPLLNAGGAGGFLYYTMPFVEGKTLRELLNREGELPIDKTVEILRDVASALAYAHRHGIAHRDIKPENVLLSDGGAVVADFGIAKAVRAAQAPGGSVSTSVITELGMALGTPRYMAPEQAAGDPMTDHRADLYALGVVAYEMLAGRPPFEGRSTRELMAAHALEEPVPVARRRPSTPDTLATLVMRCLEKRPADRPQTADQVLGMLRGVQGEGFALPTPAKRAGKVAGPYGHRRVIILAGLAAIVATVAGMVVTGWRRQAVPAKPAWFDLALPESVALGSPSGRSIALSPHGSVVAYIGSARQSLFVRPLNELSPRRLAGTDGAHCPNFSPDGQWIVFTMGGRLKKIPVAGGSPIVISDSAGFCGVWTDRNEIFFDVRGQKLFRVSANGGPISPVTRSDSSSVGQVIPSQALPGGKDLLVSMSETRFADWQIAHVALPSGTITKLVPNAPLPRYAPKYADGYIIFGERHAPIGHRDGSILAAPFSLRRVQITGPEVTLLRDTMFGLSAASDGTLAYLTRARPRLTLVAVSETGEERVLTGSLQSPPSDEGATPLDTAHYAWPRLSPDGRRIALELLTGKYQWDVWIYEMDSRTLTRLTSNNGFRPAGWSADGRSVVFMARDDSGTDGRLRAVSRVWDGSAPPREVIRLPVRYPDVNVGPPHGYVAFGDSTWRDIWVAPLDTPSARRPFAASSATEKEPRFSRDGELLAYTSDETGGAEVYVHSVVGPAARIQVSTGGGTQPVWSPDGRYLYYRGPTHVMRATITRRPSLRVTMRQTLFKDIYERHDYTNYDVFPGGRELLMIRAAHGPSRVAVLFNWREMLDQRAASR